MERIPERELMDDPAQAAAYASADFTTVNEAFVDRFLAAVAGEAPSRVVDVGCGPGDIPIRIARALPGTRITALDASVPMLALAREAVGSAGLCSRVTLVRGAVPALPFSTGTFDAVVSNSLLHHLPSAAPFWREVVRIGRRGATVVVVDLLRPDDPERAREIVDREAGDEDPILRRDFYNSLLAAFRPEEVRRELPPELAALDCRVVSDRHWMVSGRLPPTGGER